MNLLKRERLAVAASQRILTDGRYTCSYEDIPALFHHIEEQLHRVTLEREDVVALECENSLRHALTLLYLLERGRSVLVLSRRHAAGHRDRQREIPPFCRYLVSVAEHAPGAASAASERLVEMNRPRLHAVANERWGGWRPGAGGRLYLPTSGSTGRPKIAVHLHSRLLGNIMNCVSRFGLQAGDRVAIPVPIAHMYGLAAAFLPAIVAGASIDLQERSNIVRFLTHEKQFRPNVVFLTPSFCDALLRLKRSSNAYRLTVSGSGRVSPASFIRYERRFGCIVNLYGSTELGAIAASMPNDPVEVRRKALVSLLPGVQLCKKADACEPADRAHAVEELCVRHDYGFEGYVDEDGAPHAGFDPRPPGTGYATRDLARVWPGGHLEILGRTDSYVKRDGMLIATSDIEDALKTIEAIETVSVVSPGRTLKGMALVAVCVVRAGKAVAVAEVRKRCRELLPSHAVPDHVLMVRALPMLENGKIDRQRLTRMARKTCRSRLTA